MLLTHALALSASQFVRKKKSPRIYTSIHWGGFELTKLTYTGLEDNLVRHRGDRLVGVYYSRRFDVRCGIQHNLGVVNNVNFMCEITFFLKFEPKKSKTRARYFVFCSRPFFFFRAVLTEPKNAEKRFFDFFKFRQKFDRADFVFYSRQFFVFRAVLTEPKNAEKRFFEFFKFRQKFDRADFFFLKPENLE